MRSQNDNNPFLLQTSYGYVTANFDNEPPVLYVSPDKEKAVVWIVDAQQRIRHEKRELYWDLWDLDYPRVVLYNSKKGPNSLNRWSIRSRNNDEATICSLSNQGYCVNHYKADINIESEPFPFTILYLKPSFSQQSTVTVRKSGDPALDIRSTYDKGYEFPQWSLEYFKKYGSELGKQCVVYYSDGDLQSAKRLAIEREPVNIEMERHYDKDKLQQLFGWRHGFYGTFFEQTGTLAPNLAIYTPSFVVDRNNQMVPLHIINSIGYAFDSTKQPDYKVLHKKKDELFYRYVNVFKKILRCVKDKEFDVVVMSLVGGGVFSDLWENFLPTIWAPAFRHVFQNNNNKFKILFMGPNNLPLTKDMIGMKVENVGLFPDCIETVSSSFDIRKCLFVNAWDPWSMAGNGNGMDKSLDGFIGRRSMIALLCWPLTNTHLQRDLSYLKIQ